MVFHMESVRN
jgi:hypothetical protein